MKTIILLLGLLVYGCNDSVNDIATATGRIKLDINYLNNGRVYNLNTNIDSLNFSDSLMIYGDRIYNIKKDSIINFTTK